MEDQFKIDTSIELGQAYSSYKNKLYKMAISEPAKYYELRERTVAAIKKAAVAKIYDTLYYFLKDGILDGVKASANNMGADLKPQLPSSRINAIALGSAETLDNILEDAIKLLLPVDYKAIAEAKLTQKGEANIV